MLCVSKRRLDPIGSRGCRIPRRSHHVVVALLPICYLRYRAYAREKRSAGAPARTAPVTHREVAYTTEEYMEEEEEEEVYEDSDGVVRAAPRYARVRAAYAPGMFDTAFWEPDTRIDTYHVSNIPA